MMASVSDRPESPSRKRLKIEDLHPGEDEKSPIEDKHGNEDDPKLSSIEPKSEEDHKEDDTDSDSKEILFDLDFFDSVIQMNFMCQGDKKRLGAGQNHENNNTNSTVGCFHNIGDNAQSEGSPDKHSVLNSPPGSFNIPNGRTESDDGSDKRSESESNERLSFGDSPEGFQFKNLFSDDDEEEATDLDNDYEKFFATAANTRILSDYIRQHCKPMDLFVDIIGWVNHQKMQGTSPRFVFSKLTQNKIPIPQTINDILLWRIIFSIVTEFPRRKRLSHVSTLNHVIKLIKKCSKIVVLTGAGISVSCGIPDFRSKDGVYARLAEDFPDLPDPQAMFDINYFRHNPKPFFKFAKEIYPGQFQPSPCHRFIKLLEKNNKLLRNYTQNIDTLERVMGINNVIECHGSFSTATCTSCGYKVTSDQIKDAVFEQNIPLCTQCTPKEGEQNVMKPDIVFFGEGLPNTFHDAMHKDRLECDLLIVIGSSLKVRPVALIPNLLPPGVPQILINRERLNFFDVELLGDADVIVDHLCHALGGNWEKEICWREPLVYSPPLTFPESYIPSSVGMSDDAVPDNEDKEKSEYPIKCQKIGKRHIQGEHSRNISHDSSRDSGIGESSHDGTPNSIDNTYYCLRKRRYIFPGAEIKKNSFHFAN